MAELVLAQTGPTPADRDSLNCLSNKVSGPSDHPAVGTRHHETVLIPLPQQGVGLSSFSTFLALTT